MSSDSDAYDIPKPAAGTNQNYDQPRQYTGRQRNNEDNYDVPRSVISLLSQQNFTPSSSNSSLFTSDSFSLNSSNRSSLINMPDYDIPRRNVPIRAPSSLSVVSQTNYDIPTTPTPPQGKVVYRKEHHMELSTALDTLDRLQTAATAAVQKLLSFVTSNWRQPDKLLTPVLLDFKLAVVKLRTALHELSEFGEFCLADATKVDDTTLLKKIKPLVKALKDADKLVNDASHTLDINGWTVEVLCRTDAQKSFPPDSVDQLIACAQTLTEDVRQISSFIQGNATLLFKRMTPSTPTIGNNDWSEDYEEIRDSQKNFENMVKTTKSTLIELNANDKSLLIYYTTQIVTHMNYLTQAIDAFLETVQRNQPPKIFLAYGKLVVLSAYNIVNIGDIVSRNVSAADVQTKVSFCADTLTEALKQCVVKTKRAAQYFPSVTAVQEMVDSIVDVSHSTNDLKIAMLQTIGPVIQQ